MTRRLGQLREANLNTSERCGRRRVPSRNRQQRRSRPRIVQRERMVRREHGMMVRLGAPSCHLVVGRDEGVRGRRGRREDFRHPSVQHCLAIGIERVSHHARQLVVREQIRCAVPVIRRCQDPRVDQAPDAVANGLVVPLTRALHEGLVELPIQRRHELEYGDAARGEARDASLDHVGEGDVGRQVAKLAPAPPLTFAREVSCLLEVAQQVRDVQRIPLGVTIHVRQQVAPCLAVRHRALDPALHVVAREARHAQLVVMRARRQPRPPLQRVVGLIPGADGEHERDALALELRHEVLQRVPRRRVRPLHVVEQDEERALLRGEPEEIGELLEQPHLAAAARQLLRRTLQCGIEQRQLAPHARALDRQPAHGAQHLAPERVRFGQTLLMTGGAHERSAAEPHFGAEHLHE